MEREKKSEKFNIFPACLCKWKKWVYQLVNYLWIFHSYFKLLRAYFKSLESCNSREKKNEEKEEKKFLPQSLYAAKLVSASETHWIFISIYICITWFSHAVCCLITKTLYTFSASRAQQRRQRHQKQWKNSILYIIR